MSLCNCALWHRLVPRQVQPVVVVTRRRFHFLPKRIILLRHGESLGNVNEAAYSEIPDWKIPLTELGKKQAHQVGKELHELCSGESVYVYVSPYHRTMQTWQIIKQELEGKDNDSGDDNVNEGPNSEKSESKEKNQIRILGIRQEPRIAEQQFGNFQVRRR
jgi:broad specificity phosphatase PhoE